MTAIPCAGCGGPHQFDTSIASPLWNRVIRDAGLPDYLCTTCIVRVFVAAGESFEAELYGDAVNRADGAVPVISVRIGNRPIDQSYGDLQHRLAVALAPSHPLSPCNPPTNHRYGRIGVTDMLRCRLCGFERPG